VCETHNLPLYGYGAKGFTLSMIETAVELCGADLKPTLVADILAAGRSLLAHPVELFDGIAQTLEDLADRGRLVLVTKGDLLHQGAKLAASGLGDRFAGVDIVSDKTADTFTRLFKRYAVQSAEAVMAGDSMRSDVRPALEAGGWRLEAGGWRLELGRPMFRRTVRGLMNMRRPLRIRIVSRRWEASLNCPR